MVDQVAATLILQSFLDDGLIGRPSRLNRRRRYPRDGQGYGLALWRACARC